VEFVAGILTQQVELNDQRLEIGIVTEACFVRETISQLDRAVKGSAAPVAPAAQGRAAGSGMRLPAASRAPPLPARPSST